ncbi:unnamed protein product [Caenorhabditis brenneri]
MPTLLEMTDVPMKNILENCDYKSVLVLRKVCHSLRNFIDDARFKTDLDNIRITIGPTGFLLICNSPNALSTNGFCFAKDWTLNDLKIIMNLIQNSKLSRFSVITNPYNGRGLDDLEVILKNRTRPLQTEHFEMFGSEILKVLPYLDSKTLKEISIRPVNFETHDQNLNGLERFLELKQFKNAAVLHISYLFLMRADLRKFFHFERVCVKLHETSLEELVALKEAFVTSAHMQSFNLCGLKLNENQFEQVFGTPFHDPLRELDSSQWFFKIQSCKEYVLRIDWYLEQLTFWNWKATEVPQDAVVQH